MRITGSVQYESYGELMYQVSPTAVGRSADSRWRSLYVSLNNHYSNHPPLNDTPEYRGISDSLVWI